MRNLIVLGLFVFGVCFVDTIYAGEDGDAPKKEKKAKKPAPALEEITLVGTITKTEKKNKKTEKISVSYILTDQEGKKISLPTPKPPKKAKKGQPAPEAVEAVNLEDFVDAKVTISGQGYSKEKKGKTTIYLKKIVKIEKLAE